MRTQFITAAEVEKALGVSRSKAYQIIRTLNKELKAMGYITIAGKCPIQYFQRKFYGMQMGRRTQQTDRLQRKARMEENMLYEKEDMRTAQNPNKS